MATLDPDLLKRRALAVFPQATRIVLFGSQATGHARPDSDVDLLVVTPSPLRPALRAAALRMALLDVQASFDLVVLTPDEWARLKAWPSSVAAHAEREGKVLHEAA